MEELPAGGAAWFGQYPVMPLASLADYCGHGSLRDGDMYNAGAVGPDGGFYVFGGWIGYDGPEQPTIAELNPATEQWTAVGSMLTPRALLGVALGTGPDGDPYLFAIGGEIGPADVSANAPGCTGNVAAAPVTTVEAYTFW
jgi:hypothetical protein